MFLKVFSFILIMSIHDLSQGQKLIFRKFDQPELITMNNTYGWSDGLTLKLTDFTHKEPMPGGPTKATAYLDFQKAGEKGEITLSVHGSDGKEGIDYDKIHWKNYDIELLSFEYNQSIELKISKAGSNEVGYFINDRSVTKKEFADFKNSLTEVKNTWYCKEFNDGGETGYKATSEEGKIFRYKAISKKEGAMEILEHEEGKLK
ncbi:hypothetical protein WSM22_30930 [Cytophagales bacterium WSM2-2]|nr:hypothetical protein WSM22_30930 [Cytophagales bacterium WSM2-2]